MTGAVLHLQPTRPQASAPEPDADLAAPVGARVGEGPSVAFPEAARGTQDEMRDRRQRISEELARLSIFGVRRGEAVARLAEIKAALAALDRADREAVELWAAADDPDAAAPLPLVDERRALLARRIEAECDIAAAEAGERAIETRRERLQAERRSIDLHFLEHRLADVLAEVRRLQNSAVEIAKELAAPLNAIIGIREALVELAGRHANSGDTAGQRVVGATISAISELRPPQPWTDPKAIAAAAAEWSAKLR